ncbi:helix-turn-helix domain-containing protein [Streptomyces sp. XM4193]|uniref:helix-turn-helix transcriptional regulator n=1 Tax=Streptomyces sp. XM4193 TaxID=2929782 RepID=UPI001FF84CC0|nr:helix-turn-helix transcriptional regulator [Streptomyces sp. XM4193]MCK1794891.1 helix-turn-helix domain-containing protein [Streptomyces sp. XM4193]
MSSVGERIREARHRLEWSQGRLARELCRAAGVAGEPVDRQTVSRWERGVRTPREWMPLLCRVLGADLRDHRAPAVNNPSRLDGATVDALADVLSAYRRLDDHAAPHALLAPAVAHANAVLGVLREARGPHRGRLVEVASESAQFAGWMYAQVGAHRDADLWLADALDLADEAGNGTLAAQALNFHGYVARQQGRPHAIARWFGAAADTPGAHPAQRIGDYLQAAAGLAELGQRDAALRTAARAEALTDAAAALPPPDTAYWLTPAFNRLNMGIFALGLGQHADAADHLRAGLDGLPEDLRSAPWTEEHRAALQRATA